MPYDQYGNSDVINLIFLPHICLSCEWNFKNRIQPFKSLRTHKKSKQMRSLCSESGRLVFEVYFENQVISNIYWYIYKRPYFI